jgi:hypothetical protein
MSTDVLPLHLVEGPNGRVELTDDGSFGCKISLEVSGNKAEPGQSCPGESRDIQFTKTFDTVTVSLETDTRASIVLEAHDVIGRGKDESHCKSTASGTRRAYARRQSVR